MPRELIYDASRLTTRVLNSTPNGIDRIDILLARTFLSRPNTRVLRFGFGGPSLFQTKDFPDPVYKAEVAWRERIPHSIDLQLMHILKSRLLDIQDQKWSMGVNLYARKLQIRLQAPLESLLAYGLIKGEHPAQSAPKGSILINATHFPMEWRSHIKWLDERPDIRIVQFIHDLLPIERPELFWPHEPRRHMARLDLLARKGAAALVTSQSVQEALISHLKRTGRYQLPIFCAPPPVASEFLTKPVADQSLDKACYFIICGTIEPRKNHLLLVEVWRRLKKKFGLKTPKLLVIGKRGWKSDRIYSALESPDLKSSIIVVSGLPTSIYKSLLWHSAGLLAPSLAEGLGLPIGEALALGIPVIASNIEGHREYPTGSVLLQDPTKPENWVDAIIDAAKMRLDGYAQREPIHSQTVSDYMLNLESFLMKLP